MIYIKLFLIFLEIGTVSFGGGYGMISLIREKVLLNGWLNESEFLNFIGVAESTPGPIAVNMATFIGSSQGGVLGSLVATIGVILPSFMIILIIAAFIKNLLKYKGVSAFLSGVKPCVIGLILATSFTMLLSKVLNVTDYTSEMSFDIFAVIIFVLIVVISALWKKIRKKKPSPIMLIMLSAVLGMMLFPFTG